MRMAGVMSGFISHGFGGRRRAADEDAHRLPPGQYYETGFPGAHRRPDAACGDRQEVAGATNGWLDGVLDAPVAATQQAS